MKNSTLISLIRTFSREELNEFQKFIDSPLFNKKKTLSRFFGIIINYSPKFDSIHLTNEKIFKKLYPGKSFSDVIMRNTLSRTLKLAEDYIVFKEFQNDNNYNALARMRSATNRNHSILFERARIKAERTIECIQYHNEDYYYLKMMYEDELRRFSTQVKSYSILEENNLQKITDNGIYFMMTALLTLYAIMINENKHIIENNFDFSFMDNIIGYYESNADLFETMPYTSLYYNSIKLFLTEDEKYFRRVHEIIVLNYASFKEVDRKNAYVVLINYCSERINKGDLHYLNIKFKLYKEIIEKGAHYEGFNYISHVFYNRVAYASIHVGEIEWALEFIEKYRNELNEEYKNSSYNLSLAEYFAKKEEYEKALEILSEVQRTDYLFKQEVYTLSLRIFYSAGMIESFYAEIENYRNFLKNNKLVSKRRRELGLSFISLIKGLFDLKYKKSFGDKYDIFALRKKIIKNDYVTDKFWLLERLREFEELRK